MKALIIYISIHHKNTEKIAKVMAKILEARLVKSYVILKQVQNDNK
jgi:flavodoxin